MGFAPALSFTMNVTAESLCVPFPSIGGVRGNPHSPPDTIRVCNRSDSSVAIIFSDSPDIEVTEDTGVIVMAQSVDYFNIVGCTYIACVVSSVNTLESTFLNLTLGNQIT